MPRIPGYDQGPVNFAPVSGGQLQAGAEGEAQVGRAIANVGASLAQTFTYIQQKKARVYSNASMASLREYTSKTMQEARKAAGPGAPGYTDGVLKNYDDFAKDLLKNAPNKWAIDDLTASVADFRASVLDDATNFEATASEAKSRFDVRDAASTAANSLLTHPEWFKGTFADQMAAFKAITGSLSPQAETQERFDMANSLAVAAIQGEIRLSPKVAAQKLEAGYWDTYEWDGEKTTLITPEQKANFLESAKRASVTDNEVERYVMQEKIRNHLASVAETGVGIQGVNPDEVYRVFSNNGENPEKGQIAMLGYKADMGVARKVNAVKNGLVLASPGERATLLSKYKPVPGSQTFADDQKVYDQLVSWNAADQKQMLEDPAVWSDQQGDVTDTFAESGAAAAAEVSLTHQEKGGVPAHKQKVLGNAQAKDIVASLKSMEPAKVLGTLAGYEDAYGQRWGKVASELTTAGLDSSYLTAYSVAKFNPAVGADLVAALGIDEAALKADFTKARGLPWESIQSQAQILFRPLEVSQLRLAPNRMSVMQETRGLFSKAAAIHYKGDQSKDPSTVMQDMYNSSIGAMLDIRDTYYIPRVSPNGTPIDTASRADDLELSLSNIHWVKAQNFDTSKSYSPEIVSELGRWQNLSDNSGVRLVLERQSGVVPVLRGGKQVVVTYDELSRGPWKDRWTTPRVRPQPYLEHEEEMMRQ